MHSMIEAARKSAGISDLSTKNYPLDPKQRGAGKWAAFVGSLDTQIQARLEADSTTIKKLQADKSALQNLLSDARKSQMENGVEAVAISEGWDKGKQQSVVTKIAG